MDWWEPGGHLLFRFYLLTPLNKHQCLKPLSSCGALVAPGVYYSGNANTTFSNGYLGSRNDEERSEMRYVMRIAEYNESSNL